MHVSEVKISLIKPQGGLIGFASLVVNGDIFLTGIGIHRKLDGTGYRLTYPERKAGQHSFQVFHPINQASGRAIENAIFMATKNVLNGLDHHAGYDSPYVA